MTKGDLIDRVRARTGYQKKDCTELVEIIFDEMREALLDGDKIQISHFGTFEIRERRERKGFNPTLKKEITIAERRVPVFRAGKHFRESLNTPVKSSVR